MAKEFIRRSRVAPKKNSIGVEMDEMDAWDDYWKHMYHKFDLELRYCSYREDIKLILKNLPTAGNILEAGCGIGSVCNYLSQITNAKIIGVDISTEALKNLKLNNSSNIEFIKGDIRNLPFKNNSFSLITSLGVIEHLDNPRGAIIEMERVLKEDGILFISTPNSYCISDRVIKFLKMKIKKWRYGKEESFSLSQLKDLISVGSSLVLIESGYFYWGRNQLFKFLKRVFGGLSLKGASMVYVIAKKY
jgi:ubiquinone/menaquinone biosynthesis C-methylase UbiE